MSMTCHFCLMHGLTAKQIARGYGSQLKDGCDGIDCHNQMCKSCKDFSLSFPDTAALMAKIRELMASHSEADRLCKSISPEIFDPDLPVKAHDFDLLIDSLKKDREVDLDRAKSTIHEVFTNPNVFIYIQKSNSEKLTKSNFAITDEMVVELDQVVRKHWSLFSPFRDEFLQMVKCLVGRETSSFHQARALLLTFCFGLYMSEGAACPVVDDLATHLLHLTKVVEDTIKSALSSLPRLLRIIVAVFQRNLSIYALPSMPVDPNFSRIPGKQAELRSALPMNLARALQWLRDVAFMSDHHFSSSEFSNGPLSNALDPEYDVIETLKGREGQPNYMSVPAALTLSAKGQRLKLFNEFEQNVRARESIMQRIRTPMTPLSRRDLQLYIEVSREGIVEDTIRELARTPEENLLKKLVVVFKGEQGVDAGGVSREFFYLLCNAGFSPDYGMFEKIPGDKYWFSSANLESPVYFSLLGTVVALALYNFVILPIRFPKVLYKKLKGQKLTLNDLRELDEGLVESFLALRKIRDDGGDVQEAELNFTRTCKNFDSVMVIPLKEDGENIPVTNDNLEEYIELYSDHIMNVSVEKQFTNFRKGYMKLCSQPIFEIFEPDELDILVSGLEVLDWSELQKNAKYSNGYNQNSQAVQWFWEIFGELTIDQKKQFLRFSTGTDRVPIGGLKDVQLEIQRTGDPTKLPVSHTCFNILALPDYPSKEVMRQKIMIAIENNEGFGLI